MLIERLRQRNVSLIRLPRAAQLDEYEEASQEIEDLLRGLPGIVAIYRTGTVSVPGISDLDRIAVVEKGVTTPPVWSRLSERTRYLAMHAPFLVDLAGFRRHRWFAHMEPLYLSSGTAVELDDPPLPQESESLIGAESMVVALLTVVKQLSTGLLKVRPSLCQLNNIRHALALAQLSRDEAPAAWQVTGDVEKLRNAWFTSSDPERRDHVKDVAARTVPALLEALWALGERSESANPRPDGMKLGPPWSNVTLDATETGGSPVSGTARFRLPLSRSAKVAELSWRASRPRIALHPAVLALLAGKGGQERESFRSDRDELVRAHDEFLARHGRGYAGIGLASPFLTTENERLRSRGGGSEAAEGA